MNTLENIGREKLKELLNKLPDAHNGMFNRMYGSVDEIPLENISRAIQQCERSIETLTTPKEE